MPAVWVVSVLLVVILAGGLFGYDQGVISGALLGVQQEFKLGALVLEIVTSWVTAGALFGSLAGGWIADHFGRRRALLAAAALFVAGAAVEAFAPSVPVLVGGRLIVGFGVGVAADGAATGVVTLAALVVFIASFAFSLGPVTWTIINEIYPGEARGRAVAVATAVNWGAAFLVSEFFLTLVRTIGDTLSFRLFALFCGLGLIWVYLCACRRRGDAPSSRSRLLGRRKAEPRPRAGGERGAGAPATGGSGA